MLEASSETSRLEDQITDDIAASRQSRYKVLLSIRMMPMSRSRSKRRQS
jgi:hypothetical protein